jgi:hypothetical protein
MRRKTRRASSERLPPNSGEGVVSGMTNSLFPMVPAYFTVFQRALPTATLELLFSVKHFSAKKWTRDEIAGLFARETTYERRIIPIWLGVIRSQVEPFSPILCDRRAIDASKDLSKVIDCVIEAINEASSDGGFSFIGEASQAPDELLANLGERWETHIAKIAMNRSVDASKHVRDAQTFIVTELKTRVDQLILKSPKLGIACGSGEFRCIPFDILWLNIELPNRDIVRIETTRPHSMVDGLRLDLNVFRPKRNSHGEYVHPDHLEDHRFAPALDHNGTVYWTAEGIPTKSSSEIVELTLLALHRHLSNHIESRIKSFE